MTPDPITARNRVNARKSTGPRTARGKAVVAGNARQHGATARPDPGDIAVWLAILLDRPGITPADLLPEREAGYRALALAEAEIRLAAAERAVREFEAGREAPCKVLQDMRAMREMIADVLTEKRRTQRDFRSAFTLLKRISRVEEEDTMPGGRRHRLLMRYLREARGQRKKAFAAWIAMGGKRHRDLMPTLRNAGFPKQSQIETEGRSHAAVSLNST